MHGLVVEPIIGLEVHVQLATRTKLFCGCPVEFGAPPNTLTCPVCLGLPGTLPVLNRHALELAVRAGVALKCTIPDSTNWARKSYFYPDLPRNYQITQHGRPLYGGGSFEFPHAGGFTRLRIRHALLEEDAGKNVHDLEHATGVDFNRAGIPLLEIVTEPELNAADQVYAFAVELQRLMHYLDVSEAVMQKGQMRFEPNVNVKITHDGATHTTPIVEIKNLNSFRALRAAVAYEIERQVDEWCDTSVTATPGNKSNRGWNDARGVTVPQRGKEEADDYRYFPEPDLPSVTLTNEWITRVRIDLPELPVARTARFVHAFKLPPDDAPALVDDRATADLMDHAADAGGDPVVLGKQFLGCWSRFANERGVTIAELNVSPTQLAGLANLVTDGQLNATAAAQVAELLLDNDEQPLEVARRIGVLQTSDLEQIAQWVDEVFSDPQHATAINTAREDPKKADAARGYLVGQVMQLSGGRANPQMAKRLVSDRLS